MLRKRALIVAITILVPLPSVSSQSAVDPAAAVDPATVCGAYGGSELVFVGRAEEPVTFHITGVVEIERARQNLIRTETEVARLRASLDPRTRMEREAEFVRMILTADAELDGLQAIYGRPFDFTFIPVSVEQTLRGVTAPVLMLRVEDRSIRMEPGELYLISGHRSKAVIPPPDVADLGGLDEYVETERVRPVASARQEVNFLASTVSGATIVGMLRMQSYGPAPGVPLTGVRIAVSSGARVVGTTTKADGSFVVSGIAPGRLEIRPTLREDLTVVNKSALTFVAREGGCNTVRLTVELNGRVRGRILSATGTSLADVTLVLRRVGPTGRLIGGSIEDPPGISLRPNEDGTFEFSGVAPGSYVLSARFERIEDGNTRYLTTYFPGSPDAAAAVPIVIGRATQHDGFDFLVTTQ